MLRSIPNAENIKVTPYTVSATGDEVLEDAIFYEDEQSPNWETVQRARDTGDARSNRIAIDPTFYALDFVGFALGFYSSGDIF